LPISEPSNPRMDFFKHRSLGNDYPQRPDRSVGGDSLGKFFGRS
jgi:hypothetical protein